MFNSATYNSQPYNMSVFLNVLTIAALGIITQLRTDSTVTEINGDSTVTVAGTRSDTCQLQSA